MTFFRKILSFIRQSEVFPIFAVICLIILNISISTLVRNYDLKYIANSAPFGLSVEPITISLIVGFVTYGLWKFGFLVKFPIFTSLILSGVWSNYLERIIFGGSVTDYIIFSNSYLNLADIQIWVGCIGLIIQVWFFDTHDKTIETSSSAPISKAEDNISKG